VNSPVLAAGGAEFQLGKPTIDPEICEPVGMTKPEEGVNQPRTKLNKQVSIAEDCNTSKDETYLVEGWPLLSVTISGNSNEKTLPLGDGTPETDGRKPPWMTVVNVEPSECEPALVKMIGTNWVVAGGGGVEKISWLEGVGLMSGTSTVITTQGGVKSPTMVVVRGVPNAFVLVLVSVKGWGDVPWIVERVNTCTRVVVTTVLAAFVLVLVTVEGWGTWITDGVKTPTIVVVKAEPAAFVPVLTTVKGWGDEPRAGTEEPWAGTEEPCAGIEEAFGLPDIEGAPFAEEAAMLDDATPEECGKEAVRPMVVTGCPEASSPVVVKPTTGSGCGVSDGTAAPEATVEKTVTVVGFPETSTPTDSTGMTCRVGELVGAMGEMMGAPGGKVEKTMTVVGFPLTSTPVEVTGTTCGSDFIAEFEGQAGGVESENWTLEVAFPAASTPLLVEETTKGKPHPKGLIVAGGSGGNVDRTTKVVGFPAGSTPMVVMKTAGGTGSLAESAGQAGGVKMAKSTFEVAFPETSKPWLVEDTTKGYPHPKGLTVTGGPGDPSQETGAVLLRGCTIPTSTLVWVGWPAESSNVWVEDTT
jgi:hypothetical protein